MRQRLRLRREADFLRVRREGRSYAHPVLILALVPNHLPHNRYGIVTTRRLGGAVARNRVRRRIREAARYWHPHIAQGYDMVIIPRPPALTCPYPALVEAMAVGLRRANLL